MQTLTADEVIAKWESNEQKVSPIEVGGLMYGIDIPDFNKLATKFELRLDEAKLYAKQYETMCRAMWIQRNIANSRRIEELKTQLNEETRKRKEEIASVHTFVAELTDTQPSKRIKKDDDPDQTLCCICLANKRCIVFKPCRHLCCCAECSVVSKCPLCQAAIRKFYSVYY
jgi:hypothetical protein